MALPSIYKPGILAQANPCQPPHVALVYAFGLPVRFTAGTVMDALSAVAYGADLMHTLWEADVAVFKAHITTGPGGKVLDMFWIYDNRSELPENHRCRRPGRGRQRRGRAWLILVGALSSRPNFGRLHADKGELPACLLFMVLR